ncbi:MAG: RluA family pseudouridine synthase [Candidatus Cryptobacteroides sp.]
MRPGKDRELELVYEDDFILVVCKPSGMLTMSTGRKDEQTAYNILTDYVRSRSLHRGRTGRNDRVFIVHRLDRDTSGLLVFAKSEDVKYALQDSWNDSVLERKYIALAEGTPADPEGTVTSWLTENPSTFTVLSSPFDNGGKKAVTHYRVRSSSGAYSLIEFNLETGRKNQIRVHASVLGHPVAGDRKYGARTNPIGRLALHASTLAFRHPVTGKVLSFKSSVPNSFKKALNRSEDL